MNFLPYPHLKLDHKALIRASIISFIGLFLSLALCLYIKNKAEQEDQLRFEYEAEILSRRIISWMDQYKSALIQTRAFLMNSGGFDIEKLNQYLSDTEVVNRYNGLQGLGFIKIVSSKELPAFKKKFPHIEIWPNKNLGGDYYAIVLSHYPVNYRNQQSIGFNVFSEKNRLESLRKAADINNIVSTKKVVLSLDLAYSNHPAFVLSLPLYKKNANIATVEKRREALEGFIYSPFRSFELFDSVFAGLKMIVDVEIYDGKDLKPENLFYDYDGISKGPQATNKIVMPLEINGLNLTFVFTPLKNFPMSYNPLNIILIFLLGICVTFISLWTYLITTKQVMEARRVAAQRQGLLLLEKKHVKDRDEFLSIASHELKTPLTSLKLQSQIMIRNLKRGNTEALSKEKISTFIELLDVQTSRLNRLVDDMLDISRLRTGKFQVDKEKMDLQEAINSALEKLNHQFLEHHSSLQTEISGPIIGEWDRLRIEQVITNLLTNAIRYGNQRPIKIKAYKDLNFAYIEVIDQGRGIIRDNFEKIFERFERAGMSANESSGMGLGLYIAKQIVDAHNGTISLESELQKGSTFTVKLPL